MSRVNGLVKRIDGVEVVEGSCAQRLWLEWNPNRVIVWIVDKCRPDVADVGRLREYREFATG